MKSFEKNRNKQNYRDGIRIATCVLWVFCMLFQMHLSSCSKTPVDTLQKASGKNINNMTKAETDTFICNFYKNYGVDSICVAVSSGPSIVSGKICMTSKRAEQFSRKEDEQRIFSLIFSGSFTSRPLTVTEQVRLLTIIRDYFITKTKKLIQSSVKTNKVTIPGPYKVTVKIFYGIDGLTPPLWDFGHVDTFFFPFEGIDTESCCREIVYDSSIQELYDVTLGDGEIPVTEI